MKKRKSVTVRIPKGLSADGERSYLRAIEEDVAPSEPVAWVLINSGVAKVWSFDEPTAVTRRHYSRAGRTVLELYAAPSPVRSLSAEDVVRAAERSGGHWTPSFKRAVDRHLAILDGVK